MGISKFDLAPLRTVATVRGMEICLDKKVTSIRTWVCTRSIGHPGLHTEGEGCVWARFPEPWEVPDQTLTPCCKAPVDKPRKSNGMDSDDVQSLLEELDV